MWITLIKKYWLVICFKETPADTPYSPLLLGMMVCLFYCIVVMQWTISDIEHYYSLGTSILAGGLLLLSYGIYTYGLLSLFRLTKRGVQTLTCLLAGHTLVHLLAFPLLLFWWWPGLSQVTVMTPLGLMIGVIYLILTFILGIWQVMITVHIYKHALDINYFPAVLASFGLVACNILIVSLWR